MRWCSNAITTPACWRTAIIRTRSSRESRAGWATWTTRLRLRCSPRSTRRDCGTSWRPIFRSRTTRRTGRAQRWPGRSIARPTGSASPIRRKASLGATSENLWEKTMEKRQELYRGKAKTVYATDDPQRLVMHYRDDVSAFDGAKLAKLDRKGETNNRINAYVMGKLAEAGIRTHFLSLLNERESLVQAMKMIPVECVVRNIC